MSRCARCFWTEPRLARLLAAFFVAVVLSAIVVGRTDFDHHSMITRGDFPGFYAPAVIVYEGNGAELYSRPLQESVEARFWPEMRGHVLVSVYPAFLSVIFAPLAFFSPLVAKFLMAMLCLFGFLLFAFCGWGNEAKGWSAVLIRLGLTLLFPCSLISLLGGQNTGITLGLLALALAGMRAESRRGKVLAGVALALSLYKPQFGALLLVPFLLWREWLVLRSAAIMLVALVVLPMPWTGSGWMVNWFHALVAFAPENFVVNGPRMISPAAFLTSMCGTGQGVQVGGMLVSALLYGAGVYWIRAVPSASRSACFLWFAGLVAVLSPQALFYDLGLMAVSLLGGLVNRTDRDLTDYFIFCGIAGAVFLALGTASFPLFFPLAVMMLWRSFRFLPARTEDKETAH